jgi:methyl-accepting chemotaxis protein
MNNLDKISLKSKLTATCIMIALGIIVLMIVMGGATERIKVNGKLYQEIVQGKDLIADILPPPEYIIESYLVTLQALGEADAAKLPSLLERLKKLRSEYDDRHAYWTKDLPDGKIKTLLLDQSYKPAVTFFNSAEKEFFPALMANNHDQAKKLMADLLSPAYESHRKIIDEIVALTTAQNAETENRAGTMLSSSRVIITSIGLVFFATVLVIFFIITRNITGQLGGDPSYVAEIARKVADGDLSLNVTVQGDSQSVLGAMREMVANLRQIVSKVTDSAENIASASNQLHTAAEQIATGSEKVACQAATVAVSDEEISTTSGSIAQNCQIAADGGMRAIHAAQTGSEVVERTVQVMARISERVSATAQTVQSLGERSDQIGAIIGTIEDIADQTNLLALNAAIEAARAGEQGRGFAVVADEVRALAERTTKATREIGEMIKSIQVETKGAVTAMEQGVVEVEAGTGEAARSGEAIKQILEQIKDVTMQVNQIATAAEEQTATTNQISGNMTQISEVVQATAREAEETAQASGQLSRQAGELQLLVGRFRL